MSIEIKRIGAIRIFVRDLRRVTGLSFAVRAIEGTPALVQYPAEASA
jgi:hypothetical protein